MKDEIGKKLLISLVLLGLPLMSRAETTLSLDQVVDKLQANYDQARTYSAEFRQEIQSPNFERTLSEGKGEILFQKPGKMVWKYREPEAHTYILEGNTLWDYYPGEKRALRMTLDQAMMQNAPKAFLFGMGKLRTEFEISFHAGRPKESSGEIKLDLVPKSPEARTALGTLVFTVSPKDFLVREVEMQDSLGNSNHLWFDQIKLNASLEAKQFHFTPGKEVKVFDEESLPAAREEKAVKPKPGPAQPLQTAPGGTHP